MDKRLIAAELIKIAMEIEAGAETNRLNEEITTIENQLKNIKDANRKQNIVLEYWTKLKEWFKESKKNELALFMNKSSMSEIINKADDKTKKEWDNFLLQYEPESTMRMSGIAESIHRDWKKKPWNRNDSMLEVWGQMSREERRKMLWENDESVDFVDEDPIDFADQAPDTYKELDKLAEREELENKDV